MKWIVAALLIWAAWTYLKPSGKRRIAGDRERTADRAARERTDAYATLGIAPGSDDEAIRAAHRRLLTGVHPDRGGSEALARRINAARDLLLDR
ncbi:DnaJ domain-containing protein [Sphingomonas sp. KR1UV-12]|uniref:DnaJ domain-containing protein n=1 Tax=Sphingomonas aurea TaxID=3063994 RepID=A0ABT9EK28_9SPHN|nr:DnaJ domain-containing protein [Sphingomonas sp. KR1UV-12]MDP1027200.1 DnaJ domain-containing protein [Sphingomonas sp. KR1UV-12]